MMLRLTPATLEAAYNYLRTTPPFDRWSLPPGGDVKFKVSRRVGEFGRYQWLGNKHSISMSGKAIGQTLTLMLYTAHEMIHLHLEATGQESKSGGLHAHNAAFRKYAAQVCKAHGFDPKAFY
jgi:hypothetical protein